MVSLLHMCVLCVTSLSLRGIYGQEQGAYALSNDAMGPIANAMRQFRLPSVNGRRKERNSSESSF